MEIVGKLKFSSSIIVLILGFILMLGRNNRASALDAETAHPWIADQAALVWPSYPSDWLEDDPTRTGMKRLKCELVCAQGTDAQIEFSNCDCGQDISGTSRKGYLGKFDYPGTSGAFTNSCDDLGIPVPETNLKACSGSYIVEGAQEEDSTPFAGIAALSHSYDPDKPQGQNIWYPMGPLQGTSLSSSIERTVFLGVMRGLLLLLSPAICIKEPSYCLNLPFYETYLAVDADRDITMFTRSALDGAQIYFNEAVKFYKEGEKDLAYYTLGRAVHLLEDMGSPAHTHLDIHFLHIPEWAEATGTEKG